MKHANIYVVVFSLCAATLLSTASTSSLHGQTTTASQSNVGQAVQVNAKMKKIGFRLVEWKSIHSHSDQEAKETLAALQKVGCEVVTESHGDHTDVRYRCPEWKSLTLATDQLINQWSTWFQAKGIETVVMNPAINTKKATVKYRMPAPKTVHLHDAVAAKQIITTLKLVGCQVATNDHNGHMDATFSCPQWKTIELASEDSAHSWQKWLDESGFETQHTHIH